CLQLPCDSGGTSAAGSDAGYVGPRSRLRLATHVGSREREPLAGWLAGRSLPKHGLRGVRRYDTALAFGAGRAPCGVVGAVVLEWGRPLPREGAGARGRCVCAL